MKIKTGRLILLEGISSGKTMQAKVAAMRIADLGHRIACDAEPTSGPFGRVIRAVIEKRLGDVPCIEANTAAAKLLADKPEVRDRVASVLRTISGRQPVSVLGMQIIFMADRLWHCVNVLRPRLADGENIICDRYSPSTFAFGLAHGVELGDLAHWHYRVLGKSYVTPALTVYMALPPEVAAERFAKDGKVKNVFETEEGIKRTAAAYEKVWEFGSDTHYFGPIELVDGNKPIPKVGDAIFSKIRRVLAA
ncbi:MAG: hypothetical protein LiPW15_484 [Parcubacteria group bacterium LiPW_15]|nr:MAG: hypothetical protein LiPW15_484 [Parcubacteria group bacterium LiPW_15]